MNDNKRKEIQDLVELKEISKVLNISLYEVKDFDELFKRVKKIFELYEEYGMKVTLKDFDNIFSEEDFDNLIDNDFIKEYMKSCFTREAPSFQVVKEYYEFSESKTVDMGRKVINSVKLAIDNLNKRKGLLEKMIFECNISNLSDDLVHDVSMKLDDEVKIHMNAFSDKMYNILTSDKKNKNVLDDWNNIFPKVMNVLYGYDVYKRIEKYKEFEIFNNRDEYFNKVFHCDKIASNLRKVLHQEKTLLGNFGHKLVEEGDYPIKERKKIILIAEELLNELKLIFIEGYDDVYLHGKEETTKINLCEKKLINIQKKRIGLVKTDKKQDYLELCDLVNRLSQLCQEFYGLSRIYEMVYVDKFNNLSATKAELSIAMNLDPDFATDMIGKRKIFGIFDLRMLPLNIEEINKMSIFVKNGLTLPDNIDDIMKEYKEILEINYNARKFNSLSHSK